MEKDNTEINKKKKSKKELKDDEKNIDSDKGIHSTESAEGDLLSGSTEGNVDSGTGNKSSAVDSGKTKETGEEKESQKENAEEKDNQEKKTEERQDEVKKTAKVIRQSYVGQMPSRWHRGHAVMVPAPQPKKGTPKE